MLRVSTNPIRKHVPVEHSETQWNRRDRSIEVLRCAGLVFSTSYCADRCSRIDWAISNLVNADRLSPYAFANCRASALSAAVTSTCRTIGDPSLLNSVFDIWPLLFVVFPYNNRSTFQQNVNVAKLPKCTPPRLHLRRFARLGVSLRAWTLRPTLALRCSRPRLLIAIAKKNRMACGLVWLFRYHFFDEP